MSILQRGRPAHRNAGATLIETLVALSLLALGIVGVVAMQVAALAGNYDAYYRSQAAISAQDLTERVRSWQEAAATYAHNRADTPLTCTAPVMAINGAAEDLNDWLGRLGCQLPRAQAQVTVNNDQLTVVIFWQSPSRLTATESSLIYVTRL